MHHTHHNIHYINTIIILHKVLIDNTKLSYITTHTYPRPGSPINISDNFTGTGDVSAALLLAWTHIYSEKIPPHSNLQSDNILGNSLLNTVETVQAILKRTIDKKNKLKQMFSFTIIILSHL